MTWWEWTLALSPLWFLVALVVGLIVGPGMETPDDWEYEEDFLVWFPSR